MSLEQGYYQSFGNTKPLLKSQGVCVYCNTILTSARFRVAKNGKLYCNDYCQRVWTQRRKIRKTTTQIINIAQELEMDCCYTVEEVRRSLFEELKEMAIKLIGQIKSQFLKTKEKIKKAKIHLLNNLHSLIQRLLRLLGIKEDEFALPMPAES